MLLKIQKRSKDKCFQVFQVTQEFSYKTLLQMPESYKIKEIRTKGLKSIKPQKYMNIWNMLQEVLKKVTVSVNGIKISFLKRGLKIVFFYSVSNTNFDGAIKITHLEHNVLQTGNTTKFITVIKCFFYYKS